MPPLDSKRYDEPTDRRPGRRQDRPFFWTARFAFLAGIAMILLVGVRATGSAAHEARVVDLAAETDGAQLFLSFELRDGFDDELRRRIASGLATELGYDYRLVERRRWWLDDVLGSGHLRVTALYNSVTREYLINFKHNGDLIESRVVRDADAMEDAMTRFTRLPIPGLAVARHLRVRVRAELGTRTRLFFIPTTRTTEWAEASKITPISADPPAGNRMPAGRQ